MWKNVVGREKYLKEDRKLPHHLRDLDAGPYAIDVSARLYRLLCKVQSLQQFDLIPKISVKAVVEGFGKDVKLFVDNGITTIYVFDGNRHPLKEEEHAVR